MGSFKGYTFLIKTASTGYPVRKLYLPSIALIPISIVAILLTILASLSVTTFVYVGVLNLQSLNEDVYTESLQDQCDQLALQAEEYKAVIDHVIDVDDQRRITYGLPVLDRGMLQAGIGGTPLQSTIAEENLQFELVDALKLQEEFESYARQTYFIDSTLLRVKEQIEQRQARLRETPSIWPTYGNRTSGYGYRHHPILGTRTLHDGLDIANRPWTPIIAPADGIVERAHFSTGGYGKQVIISHPSSGYTTRFAHLIDMKVSTGDIVKRGELIGFMGNTGRSTGPHLHYEIVKDGRKIDPAPFLITQLPIESELEEN